MPSTIRVFVARRILTMNASLPVATHVAVREGRILGFGGAEVLREFGTVEVDDRFAGRVLMPGFIEGHGHAVDGLMWRKPYVGFYPRRAPDGTHVAGLKSIAEVVARLQEVERLMTDPDAPVVAWGFDPIFFDGPRMTTADLDSISTHRMVMIGHVSGHIQNVNTRVLEAAGFSRDSNLDGLVRDANGALTGELQGPAVMGRASRAVGDPGILRAIDAPALWDYARIAQRVGVTTSTDLANALNAENVAALQEATTGAGFPLRLVPAMRAREYSLPEGLARIADLKRMSHDKLHFGIVKLVVDGSIQGFTARLRWPGYHNGAPNGLFYIAPSELGEIVAAYHAAGHQLHIHTNGDEASELATEMVGRAIAAHPRADHRHTLQHCQMADAAIFKRMAAFGMCVNLFANHIWYWGEQHRALTMGPSRANRLDACATALAAGVPLGIHSDVPVTPLDPLFTAWCAVNRITPAGRVLGAGERITVPQALYAITMGAATTLKMDHLIGSVDVGKYADFAVLEQDPNDVPASEIKDVGVCGTVLGGVPGVA